MKTIGALSGTSFDAIDVALFDLDTMATSNFIDGLSIQIPENFKNTYFTLIESQLISLRELSLFQAKLGILFANAINQLVKKNNLAPHEISIVGCHGQTVCHYPYDNPPHTLQLLDPTAIVEHTGISVVCDFRRADVSANGQGAPLAPLFHREVFHSTKESRIILNLGGIANITLISSDSSVPVRGYDVGPANCLIDTWIQKSFGAHFDDHGSIALSGKPHSELLKAFLNYDYFLKPPPKSTGREVFNLDWVRSIASNANFNLKDISRADVARTLTELTVRSITREVLPYIQQGYHLYVCGGGCKNTFLMGRLEEEIQSRVQTTAALGYQPDWIEAALFGWLAYKNIHQSPVDLRDITGSTHPVLLGARYDKPQYQQVVSPTARESESNSEEHVSQSKLEMTT